MVLMLESSAAKDTAKLRLSSTLQSTMCIERIPPPVRPAAFDTDVLLEQS